ncbi:MAG: 3,4-dihydroxy-2-butanone-4-phosphate synthase [Gammaproteobacteria bacterium]|nr:3,4-dihydroxy-2-butanone-4-phosphate synthase [Gammaproteobacteria bacterium]
MTIRAETTPTGAGAAARAADTVFNSVDEAVRAIAAGEMIVVVDDADRENEGDLVMAAERATPEQIAFIIRHTSGIVCAPLGKDTARRLRLDAMVAENDAPMKTAFTVSVDYRVGLTTGISAEERASTMRALANNNVGAEDFVRPGHVFPLIARDGGVLSRSGHTEASVDLARMAGLAPVGVLAELVNDDGTVKRLPALLQFAEEHGLKIVSIADIIAHRQRRERLVEREAEFEVMTEIGPARGVAYSTPFDTVQHLALVFGEPGEGNGVPVRIHRENIVADVFASRAAPENDLIAKTLARFSRDGRGVLLYLREGSSGVPAGALGAVPGAEPASFGAETSEATRKEQWRDVGVGAQILRDLGVTSIKLLATQRRNYVGLSGFGIEVVQTEILGD